MLEIDHGSGEINSPWSFKIEGKIMNEMSEQQLLQDKSSNFRFLSFFERVKIEFPNNENLYQSINWIKAKSQAGSNIDCLKIARNFHSTDG